MIVSGTTPVSEDGPMASSNVLFSHRQLVKRRTSKLGAMDESQGVHGKCRVLISHTSLRHAEDWRVCPRQRLPKLFAINAKVTNKTIETDATNLQWLAVSLDSREDRSKCLKNMIFAGYPPYSKRLHSRTVELATFDSSSFHRS